MKNFLFKISNLCMAMCGLTGFFGCSEVEIKHDYEHMIYVNESSLELFCGDTRQLTASPTDGTFNWMSEDPEVVEVDPHGMVTAKNEGNTRIVVTQGEYKEYVEVKVEVPSSKSVQAHAGKGRVQFEVVIDNEYVQTVKVECMTDHTSMEHVVDGQSGVFKFFYEGLDEDAHNFSVTCIDRFGNVSDPVEVSANVYGAEYQSALRNRGVAVATRFGNGLVIQWKDIPGDCVLNYKNAQGDEVEKIVPASETNTYLYDFSSDLTYTSRALPEVGAVDTFTVGPDRLEAFEDLRAVLTSSTPCVIHAFNFDLGGEGVGYHDDDPGNNSGNNYRAEKGDVNSPGVDLEAGGNVGYTSHGEWLMYTVHVQDAGTYAFDLERAVNNEGRNAYYSLEIDGVSTDYVFMQDDNDWNAYKWQHETYPENQPQINFTEGKHTVKFVLGKDGDHGKVNFRNLRFTFVNE